MVRLAQRNKDPYSNPWEVFPNIWTCTCMNGHSKTGRTLLGPTRIVLRLYVIPVCCKVTLVLFDPPPLPLLTSRIYCVIYSIHLLPKLGKKNVPST